MTPSSTRKGGPILIPGHPEKSPLIARIISGDPDEVMPPPEAKKKLERKEIAVLRETPTPVVKRIVAKRAALLKERFAGTSEAETAAKLLAEVEGAWTSLRSKQTQDEIRRYVERANRHLAAGELALAELYFAWVVEADPDGDLGKSARNQIKIIEGRRARDVRILLQ